MDQLSCAMFFGGLCGGLPEAADQRQASASATASNEAPAAAVEMTLSSPQDDEKTVNGTASTQKLADKQPGFGSSQNIRAPSAATPPGDKVKQLPEVSDSRLWQLVRPYKLYMLIGAFGAAVAGVVLPLESLLIST